MAAQHRRGERFALLASDGRHMRPSGQGAGAHRAPSTARRDLARFGAAATALPVTLLAYAALGTAASSGFDDSAVIGGFDGDTDQSVTVIEFTDAMTVRVLGCGRGSEGLAQQQALVLTGTTPAGDIMQSELDDESIFRTPTGVWNCAVGTITSPDGAELTAIAGEQPATDGVNSWAVDNPYAGSAFDDSPMTHAGLGTPPSRVTRAQADAAVQAALGATPNTSKPPVVRYRH